MIPQVYKSRQSLFPFMLTTYYNYSKGKTFQKPIIMRKIKRRD